jgi:signal peptidase I
MAGSRPQGYAIFHYRMDETLVPAKPAQTSGSFKEFAKFVIIVIVIVVAVRMFIAQPFIVQGTSMVPTFQNSNYLIIDELSYRFESPKRGDVLIFHPPKDPKVYYIKRIIGVPGDTVIISHGIVTITNKDHPDGLTLDEPYISPDNPNDTFSKLVTDGNYFMMGDNRQGSYDSRGWGLLPRQNITGRAFLRLFPLSEFSLFPGEHNNYQ